MKFEVSRLGRGERVVGISAVLFFIFLFFFKWYGFSSNVTSVAGVNVGGSYSANGWHTFTNSRWLWLLTTIVALVAVARAAGMIEFDSPVPLGTVVAALGGLSTIFILYRIIDHPTASASFGNFHASVGIKIGIWLGLIAMLGVTYGGYLMMQGEGASLHSLRDHHGGDPVPDHHGEDPVPDHPTEDPGGAPAPS